MTVSSRDHPVCYRRIASLVLLVAWSAAATAAPPDALPNTAADIERALSVPDDSKPAPQLRGGPSTGTPGAGRVRGLGGIVSDPGAPSAQPTPSQTPPAQGAPPAQPRPTSPAPTASPEAIARTDYPTLVRDRPKTAALIYFDTNSARIRGDAYPLLNEYVNALQGATLGDAVLVIAGHTDAAGSDRHNLHLSEQRARAVKDYLVARGIAPRRLIARGFGEAYPVASNATEDGREMNRRSEFIRIDVAPAATR